MPTKPPKWSDLGVLTLITAAGLFFSALVTLVSDFAEATVEPATQSALCQDADRARVAQLVNILERNRSADAPVLERAISGLNLARQHCLSDWNDVASDLYVWLEHWLDEHR
jgi:hypothetical protein